MWPALIPVLGSIFDRIIPDPQAAAEAKLKAYEMAQRGELATLDADMRMALGQMEVNKAEAGTDDAYTRRWRPTIGYIMAAALAFHYIVNPLLLWAAALLGTSITPPAISLDENMMEIIFGILGLAGWRSLDKFKKS
jgi:hypothetical protein